MGIANTFDNKSEEIIIPSVFAPKIDGFPEIAIAAFRQQIVDTALEMYGSDTILSNVRGGGTTPIYELKYNNKRFALCFAGVGGPVAVTRLEQVISRGAKKILYFGSCGVLDKGIEAGNLIVPTSAYRDEGTSYHYAPASDYIEIRTASRISEIMNEINIPYVCGKTWTTDAPFRETRDKMERLKKDGCIAVEMECASLMAAGHFRSADIYQFLYAADNLDSKIWDARILGNEPKSGDEQYLRIAMEVASRI